MIYQTSMCDQVCMLSDSWCVRSFSPSLPSTNPYFGYWGGDRRMTVLISCMILLCAVMLMRVRVMCEVEITFSQLSHRFLHPLLPQSTYFRVIFYLNPHKSSLSYLLIHLFSHLCCTICNLSCTYVMCNSLRLF